MKSKFAISNALTCMQQGTAAEFLVCFDLARRGYDVVHNPFPGAAADLLVDVPGTGVLKIQVKSAQEAAVRYRRDRGYEKRYRFNLEGCDYAKTVDLMAFVALDRAAVVYRVPQPGKRCKTSLGPTNFQADRADSLPAALLEIMSR